MSKYLSVVHDPRVSEERVAKWRAEHAARAYFVALEGELVELAESLTASGRAVSLLFGDRAIYLKLRENGPQLAFSVKGAVLTRTWMDADSGVARSDASAPVPVPSNPSAFASEAEDVVRALVPTINTLLT